jgi:cobalt-precorrin-5B (C1)-methyltransferase
MNTHSRTADCRRELFVCHAALCGADSALCRALMGEVSTEGCLAVLERAGLREKVTKSLLSAIQETLSRRCGQMRAGALLFSNSFGLLGMTAEAEKELEHWRRNE